MKKWKKIAGLLLAMIMAVSLAVPAFAAEEGGDDGNLSYEAANAYALNYDADRSISTYRWQYFSPYYVGYDTGLEGEKDAECIAFTMYNTYDENQYFPVYCTDLFSPLYTSSDAWFRRLNLEDATFYAPGAAGLLRAIVRNGYPWAGLEAIAAAAGVEGLTVGEAVTATQAAIWSASHGSLVELTDYCSYFDLAWSSTATEHYEECNAEIESGYASEENEALIESHIEAVYTYLMALPAAAPVEATVSSASFGEWDCTVTQAEDGTCTLTVTANVSVTMKEGDSLTLSAVLSDGTYLSTQLSAGTQTKTLTFTGVSADVAAGEVTLAIDGTQTVGDVYLFDAEGTVGATQSLIGYLDTQLPVHAEVSSTPRILNLHKYTPVAGEDYTTKTPLANVSFAIYYVGTLSDFANGKLGLNEVPTAAEVTKYAVQDGLIGIVTTDENGFASINLGTEDAVYLVVELETNQIVASLADPFYVAVPGVAEDGSYDYTVDVYPKNDVVTEEVTIEKDVTEINNDSSTYHVGETHTWIIQSSIPVGIAQGQKYVITDTLNHQLTYVGNLKVTVAGDDDPAGSESADMILIPGTDYLYTETSEETEQGTVYSFAVSLTTAGMEKVAKLASGSFAGHEIRVYFDACIDTDALLDTEIPNQAKVDYTNTVGLEYDAESDIPEVHTGGLNVKKVDAAVEGEVLSGAEFMLAEIADESDYDAILTVNGEKVYVNYVDFYTSADLTGEKVSIAVTGEAGTVSLCGVAYGDYYLIETKAPAGYNKLTEPVLVTVNSSSSNTDEAEGSWIVVENQSGIILPSTGGMGTTLFYVIGGALILAAGILLVLRKRMTTAD